MLSITIDLESRKPVYHQVADEIRGLIARGELATGASLPSVRRLGAAIGVNLNTVAKAYRLLAEEGLVQLRHGASAKVRVPPPSYRAASSVPEADHRTLHALLSRWVIAGANRGDVERRLAEAVDDYFIEKGTEP